MRSAIWRLLREWGPANGFLPETMDGSAIAGKEKRGAGGLRDEEWKDGWQGWSLDLSARSGALWATQG